MADRPPRGYQIDYTAQPAAARAMHDRASRKRKATKILAVLEDACPQGLTDLNCLDLACSTGIMTRVFAGRFDRVVGIDIDEAALEHARQHEEAENLRYEMMDALHTSFADESFDVLICNQMYEHVPDPAQLMAEAYRLLRPGGCCYFGATNRLKLVETHYGRIPLLSIMPRPLADRTLRWLGRADAYYERLLTYPSLRRLVAAFELEDYTARVLRDPRRFAADDLVRPGSLRQRLALAVLASATWVFPGFIWVLRKPTD